MSLLFKLFIAQCLLHAAKISLLSAHMTLKQLLILMALFDLAAPFHYLHLEHSLQRAALIREFCCSNHQW